MAQTHGSFRFYQACMLDLRTDTIVPCSVCNTKTNLSYTTYLGVALCSDKCKREYGNQWLQVGLKQDQDMVYYNGLYRRINTDRLKKNSAGEVCLIAWDSHHGDEYSTIPEILIPLSKISQTKQA
jgi:hypothetical protein